MPNSCTLALNQRQDARQDTPELCLSHAHARVQPSLRRQVLEPKIKANGLNHITNAAVYGRRFLM